MKGKSEILAVVLVLVAITALVHPSTSGAHLVSAAGSAFAEVAL